MVKEISTRGLRLGLMEDLDGWASSEFGDDTLELLDKLEVPVPELKEPKQHPWGLPAKTLETGEVGSQQVTQGNEADYDRSIGGKPTIPTKKKPGPERRVKKLVPDDVIKRLMAAKKRSG